MSNNPNKLIAHFLIALTVLTLAFGPSTLLSTEPKENISPFIETRAAKEPVRGDCLNNLFKPKSPYRFVLESIQRFVDRTWDMCGRQFDKVRCNIPFLVSKANEAAAIGPHDPRYYPYPLPTRNLITLALLGMGGLWAQSIASSQQISPVVILGFLYFANEYVFLPFGEDPLSRLSDLFEQLGYLLHIKHLKITLTRAMLRSADRLARNMYRSREREEAARLTALKMLILQNLNMARDAYEKGHTEDVIFFILAALEEFYTVYREFSPLDPNVVKGARQALRIMTDPELWRLVTTAAVKKEAMADDPRIVQVIAFWAELSQKPSAIPTERNHP